MHYGMIKLQVTFHSGNLISSTSNPAAMHMSLHNQGFAFCVICPVTQAAIALCLAPQTWGSSSGDTVPASLYRPDLQLYLLA